MRRPSGDHAADTDGIAVAGEYGELFGRVRVPDARGVVKGGGDDAPPVGRDTQRTRPIAMAGEHVERLGRVRVPDARGLVERRR